MTNSKKEEKEKIQDTEKEAEKTEPQVDDTEGPKNRVVHFKSQPEAYDWLQWACPQVYGFAVIKHSQTGERLVQITLPPAA